MADRFQGVSERTYDLSLAVNPFDAYTGRPLRRAATVSIEAVPTTPRLNPTGYWLYLTPPVELPSDPVTVTVETPPRYVNRSVEIRTATLDPPATRIEMYPSTAYEFPRGTTLLQGAVVTGPNEPVDGATVQIERTDLETRTATDGSFVIPIEGIVTTESARSEDVLRVDPESDEPRRVRDYSRPDSPATPTVVVEHRDLGDETVERELTEGERTVLDSPIEL